MNRMMRSCEKRAPHAQGARFTMRQVLRNLNPVHTAVRFFTGHECHEEDPCSEQDYGRGFGGVCNELKVGEARDITTITIVGGKDIGRHVCAYGVHIVGLRCKIQKKRTRQTTDGFWLNGSSIEVLGTTGKPPRQHFLGTQITRTIRVQKGHLSIGGVVRKG